MPQFFETGSHDEPSIATDFAISTSPAFTPEGATAGRPQKKRVASHRAPGKGHSLAMIFRRRCFSIATEEIASHSDKLSSDTNLSIFEYHFGYASKFAILLGLKKG